MNKFFLIVLLLFLSKSNYAYNETKLLATINKWNELHNGGDVEEFLDLYTHDVYFYGKMNPVEKCYELKKKFLNEDFSQSIITDISIEEYDKDIFKCDFTKEANSNGRVKQHNCYLLLQEIEGEYYVYGESDYETENKKGVSANIGQPINKEQKIITYSIVNSTSNNWIYWVLLLLLITGLGYFFYKKNNNLKTSGMSDNLLVGESVKPAIAIVDKDLIKQAIKEIFYEIEIKQKNNTELSSGEKGFLFEKYIVQLLDKKYFKVIEWRSDKIADNGLFAETSKLPDLEIVYMDGQAEFKLAIECKWRQSFYNDGIDWSNKNQIDNYVTYQHKNRLPVFVAIGIGGTPSKPNELYLTSLDNVASFPNIFKSYLRQYGRSTTSNLYYNKVNKWLT